MVKERAGPVDRRRGDVAHRIGKPARRHPQQVGQPIAAALHLAPLICGCGMGLGRGDPALRKGAVAVCELHRIGRAIGLQRRDACIAASAAVNSRMVSRRTIQAAASAAATLPSVKPEAT
ncbi:hypothetical protein [Rhodobaculum claviforme]|uniref:hypothetical protein n=1 Tax=Rhodobaculum claviforme TaxID=1549854 RepID=UPI001914C5D8|nr:hypothetical protein [Rhodobaculum claviforme]